MDEKLGSIKYMYVFMIFINGRGGGGGAENYSSLRSVAFILRYSDCTDMYTCTGINYSL